MSYLSLLATTTTIIPSSATLAGDNPLRRKAKSLQPLPVHHVGNKRLAYPSCEQKNQSSSNKDESSSSSSFIDRRNMLLGMGSIYGSTTIHGCDMSAVAAPIGPPDFTYCNQSIDDGDGTTHLNCCPPPEITKAYLEQKIVPFRHPSCHEPMRVRKPAHKLAPNEIAKFNKAIAAMKSIKDPLHPWNFNQQAKIHCTYCDDALNEVNTNVGLQIHGSWLFFPWHRMYLYFWERILGKLIGDPTFAIPYWNWDTPDGMTIPSMYLNEKDYPALYDDNRNKDHYSQVWNYNFSYTEPDPTPKQTPEVIWNNLCQIDRRFVEAEFHKCDFMGVPLHAGQEVEPNDTGAGGFEMIHNVLHSWVGSPDVPYHDLGSLAFSAHDPIFFGHHGNVDRMWDIYNKCRGGTPEFRQGDWLNSSFIFYDENNQVVQIKVRDVLTPEQLRYSYQPECLPWRGTFRNKCLKNWYAKKKKATVNSSSNQRLALVPEFGSAPRELKDIIRATVKRPSTTLRSDADKQETSEVLIVEGIKFPKGDVARFDVYVTDAIQGDTEDHGVLAGSFVQLGHGHGGSSNADPIHEHKTKFHLGITMLLEGMGIEGVENLVVTLVPRYGEVTVGGIKIKLVDHHDCHM